MSNHCDLRIHVVNHDGSRHVICKVCETTYQCPAVLKERWKEWVLPCPGHKIDQPTPVAASPTPRKSRGVGDTIEKTIKLVTGGRVKPCGGCRKRRDTLNKVFPYKDKTK